MITKYVKKEIFAILLLTWAVFVFISLVSYYPGDPSFFTVSSVSKVHNYAGLVGSYLSDLLFQIFGYGAWFFVIVPVYLIIVFITEGDRNIGKVIPGTLSLFFIIPPILHIFLPIKPSSAFYPGGMLGKLEGVYLEKLFGRIGVYVILGGLLIIAVIYSTGISLLQLLKKTFDWVVEFFKYSEKIEDDHQTDYLEEDEIENTRKTIEVTADWSVKEDSTEHKKRKTITKLEEKPFVLGDDVANDTSTDFTLGFEENSPESDQVENVPIPPDVLPSKTDDESGVESNLEESGEIKIYEVEQENRRSSVKTHKGSISTIRDYTMPDISLLQKPSVDNVEVSEIVLKEKAKVLKNKLAEFRVDGKIVGILPGPIITRFEFVPAPGVKVAQVINLADDLSMALKAKKVRIAVISEKGVVGIEVPNEHRRIVRLREIIESAPYHNPKLKLPLILGLDIAGVPIVEDLTDMPHLLIAGTTGSGKSVGINSILIGLLYRYSPKTLKLVLVDPKLVELSVYSDIPHLLVPVISESDRAVGVLRGIVEEMEKRYYMLRLMHVRNIEEYNSRFEKMAKGAQELWIETEKELLPKPDIEVDSEGKVKLELLPYIVVVIDEYSDLMFATGKKVEEFVARLAQKARAAGIHLILATQRPSAKVVTGIIKSNLPARIAYNVRSSTDSRIILDDPGASQLLGKGDMLFLHPSRNELKRIQGPLVTLEEVRKVVEFWKGQGTPKYRDDLIKLDGEPESSYGNGDENRFKDEVYYRALRITMEEGEISASRLQRRLGIGYNRAARYVEMMEREGIISKADGVKPRKVLKYVDVDKLEGKK